MAGCRGADGPVTPGGETRHESVGCQPLALTHSNLLSERAAGCRAELLFLVVI